jgi:hypothetical protein
MRTFAEFIWSVEGDTSNAVPLVHSTRAVNLKPILQSSRLEPSPCPVFGRDILYLFAGRPGYKHAPSEGEDCRWQLPACFILRETSCAPIERIYPFDTGAHEDGRLPSFVSVFPRERFEVKGGMDAVRKLIGAYFLSFQDYLFLAPKSVGQFRTQYDLNVFDEEAEAIQLLAAHRGYQELDDRRMVVEVQTELAIPLAKPNVLAVICPSPYLDDDRFRSHVTRKWQAEAISYPVYSLSYQNYVGLIYERVIDFYKELKVI